MNNFKIVVLTSFMSFILCVNYNLFAQPDGLKAYLSMEGRFLPVHLDSNRYIINVMENHPEKGVLYHPELIRISNGKPIEAMALTDKGMSVIISDYDPVTGWVYGTGVFYKDAGRIAYNDGKRWLFRAAVDDSGLAQLEYLRLNSEMYSCGFPVLSKTGERMYFSSDMPGGYGGVDIYEMDLNCRLRDAECFRNMGVGVNSTADEYYPFLMDDVFYFSSNRDTTHGFDVYKVDFDGLSGVGVTTFTSADRFEQLSTDDDDLFLSKYSFDEGESHVFGYARSKENSMDWVWFLEPREKSVDSTEEDIETVLVDKGTENDANLGGAIGEYNLDFLQKIGGDTCYNQLADLSKFMDISKFVKMENGGVIFFGHNSSYFGNLEHEWLDSFVERIQSGDKNVRITLIGHSSYVGTQEYNKELGLRRALRVKRYLVGRGIQEDQIYVESVGDSLSRALLEGIENAENLSNDKFPHWLFRRVDIRLEEGDKLGGGR